MEQRAWIKGVPARFPSAAGCAAALAGRPRRARSADRRI